MRLGQAPSAPRREPPVRERAGRGPRSPPPARPVPAPAWPSTGQRGQRAPRRAGPARVAPVTWRSGSLRRTPPGPIAVEPSCRAPMRSGAESVHRLPLVPGGDDARRPARVAARSRATRPEPAAASREHVDVLAGRSARPGPPRARPPRCRRRCPRHAGPAAARGDASACRPLNAAAVRPVTSQARPAGGRGQRPDGGQPRPRRAEPAGRARPPAAGQRDELAVRPGRERVAARRPGRGSPGPPTTSFAPLSVLAASGEKVRSWLGRNPVSSDPPPGLATTRPPLSATPRGVTSRQAAERRRPHEQLPEVVVLGGRPAHLHDRPARRPCRRRTRSCSGGAAAERPAATRRARACCRSRPPAGTRRR